MRKRARRAGGIGAAGVGIVERAAADGALLLSRGAGRASDTGLACAAGDAAAATAATGAAGTGRSGESSHSGNARGSARRSGASCRSCAATGAAAAVRLGSGVERRGKIEGAVVVRARRSEHSGHRGGGQHAAPQRRAAWRSSHRWILAASALDEQSLAEPHFLATLPVARRGRSKE